MDRVVPTSTPIPIRHPRDIFPAYRGSPVGDLLAYHNLGRPHARYSQARLLIGMCMDHRKRLRVPEQFAYIMRSAGANFRGMEFQISFAIAAGGVRAIALVGHDGCGMVGLSERRRQVVDGLVTRAGWDRFPAERHFDEFAPRFDIANGAEFIRQQAQHLSQQYPRVLVAPLMYRLADGMLYQLDGVQRTI